MRRLFRQFSFPGGIPSHVAPETPGSIHEGGELGYALAHAFGAAFDNPELLVACVVGDGEAETGPLATSWHANKFLNARTDGAVLPILHLNGYKIANPTVLARIPEAELVALLEGYGWRPIIVAGDEPDGRAPGCSRRRSTTRSTRSRRRSARRASDGVDGAPAVADDRAAHAEGLDRPEGGRRPPGRGDVALAPGARDRRAREPGAPADPRGVAAELPPRGALRRERAARRGARRARAARRAPHEREPARERRRAPARPRAAGLPRLRRRRSRSRGRRRARRRACSAASSAT